MKQTMGSGLDPSVAGRVPGYYSSCLEVLLDAITSLVGFTATKLGFSRFRVSFYTVPEINQMY